MKALLGLFIILSGVYETATSQQVIPNKYFKTKLPVNVMIDSIAVTKSIREMRVFNKGKLLKGYRIHLGLQPVGAKRIAGDLKTPEGLYRINSKNAQSHYHKSLGISYPNKEDILRAKRMGHQAGSDVVIHGWPNGKENAGPQHYQNDWTSGCIGVLNQEIDELFEHIAAGTPILIVP